MHEAQKTSDSWRAGSEPRESIVTRPPIGFSDFQPHGRVAVRQDLPTVTCGYFSFNDEWWPWACVPATTCKTIASHFGCGRTVYTTCYPKTDDHCTHGVSLGPRELCCSGDRFTACITGIKNQDGSEITAYNCGSGILSGELNVYETRVRNQTDITRTSDGTATMSNYRTGNGTNGIINSEADSGNATDVSGSVTPVGTIVGGVVGGLALIALVGFGIWFIRFQHRKAAAKKVEAEREEATQLANQYATPPQTYPLLYQPPTEASPPPADTRHHQSHDESVIMENTQVSLKPDQHTNNPIEMPLENARDPMPLGELQ